MTSTGPDLPPPAELLRVEVSVPLDADAAFALVTTGMAGWWPAGTSLRMEGAAEGVVASMTPGEHGRWVESGPDGEVVLGDVATWDPPRLVGLTWRPHGDAAGRVEVRTAPVEDDLTTVIVEHHLGGAAATDGSRRHLAGEQGWWAVLRAYAAAARPSG
jgi:uncharacterized protein YndB with AHSA1/START domain